MNGYTKKSFSAMCAMLMIILSFHNVLADNGMHVDVFKDSNGNKHTVWREEVNGTWQVIYSNNIGDNKTGIGHGGITVTSSIYSLMYPQIAIDPVSDICYILWIGARGNENMFWYCGSNDFITWTCARHGSILPPINENPTLDVVVDDYTMYVTWKHGGALTINPDLDGDFISDNEDANPFVYNVFGDTAFNADAVAVNELLGVSVAIDYNGTSTVKPMITLVENISLNGSLGTYVSITTESNLSFSSIIKFKYDNTKPPENITEKYLRMYWRDGEKWQILKNESAGEDTNVNLDFHYVWASTSHFTAFTVAESSEVDSDDDGLTDAEEINADGAADAVLTTFSDGSNTSDLIFETEGFQTVYINIPVYTAGMERISSARINLTNYLYAFEERQITSLQDVIYNNPSIYGDRIVWSDNRNGNYDIFIYNLTTGIETQISNDSRWEGIPKVWSDHIVWHRDTNIVVQNIVTKDECTIGTGYAPDIFGGYIVWARIYDKKIALYNIDTQTSQIISEHGGGSPHIYGDYVAYRDDTINAIILYCISTGEENIITPGSSDPFLLDIDDKYVIYQDWLTKELYVYDIAENTTTQITDKPVLEDDPTISENIAVWTDLRNDGGDIYAYDVERGIEIPVCTAPEIQANPAIFGDKIAWQDARDGYYNQHIYLASRISSKVSMYIGDSPARDIEMTDDMTTTPDFSRDLHNYLYSHTDSDDGEVDGFVSVPLTFSSSSVGFILLSNLNICFNISLTNPLKKDTDNDNFLDVTEVRYGTNPNKVDYYWRDAAVHTIEHHDDGWPYYTWYGAVMAGGVSYVIHYNILSAINVYDYSSVRVRVMSNGQEIIAVNSNANVGWHSVTIRALPVQEYYLQLKIHTKAGGGSITFTDFTVAIGYWRDNKDHVISCDVAGVPYHTWYNALTGGVPYLIHYNIAAIDNVNEEYSSVRVRLMSNGKEVLDIGSDANIGWHTVTIPGLPVDEYYIQLKIQTNEGGGSVTLTDFILNVGSWQDITYRTIEYHEEGWPYYTWYNAITGGVPYVVYFNILSVDNVYDYSSIRVRDDTGAEIMALNSDVSIGLHAVAVPILPVDKYYLQLKIHTKTGGGSITITEFGIDVDNDEDGVGYWRDMDPLVNLQVTVKVMEILQLDDVDSDGDFFIRVFINGVDFFGQSFSGDNTPGWTNANDGADWDKDAHKTPEEIGDRFTYTLDVPDDVEYVSIQIELFDDDNANWPWEDDTDDRCDISGRETSGNAGTNPDDPESGRACQMTYSIKTGQWTGDDYLGDANGYGHVRGDEPPDGSTGDGEASDHEDDCAIWFDITQNDADGDGLTWWQEVNIYETDPTVRNDRYAVIICGYPVTTVDWYPAQVHVINTWHTLLHGLYKYKQENIFIVFEPRNPDDLLSNIQIYDSSPTKAEVRSLIQSFKSGGSRQLDTNDYLTVVFSCHQGSMSDPFGQTIGNGVLINLPATSGSIYESEMASDFSNILGNINVIIEACHSATLLDGLGIVNRIVMTGPDKDFGIHAGIMGESFFGRIYCGYGIYYNSDIDGNGYVSLGEAFHAVSRYHQVQGCPNDFLPFLNDDGDTLGHNFNGYDQYLNFDDGYKPDIEGEDGYLSYRRYL